MTPNNGESDEPWQETYNAGDGLNMPYSLEAEQAVLGAVLMDPSSLNSVADKLMPEHFYLPRASGDLPRDAGKNDTSNQTDRLCHGAGGAEADGSFSEEKDGKTYLFKLAQMVPSVANIDRYARDCAAKNTMCGCLITAAREILTDAMRRGDGGRPAARPGGAENLRASGRVATTAV